MTPRARRAALKERDSQMRHARDAMAKFRNSRDPIYKEMARVHVHTARAFSRHVWARLI